MDKDEARELIITLQAFVEGKKLRRRFGQGWVDDGDDIHIDQEYEIVPEPREFWIAVGDNYVLHSNQLKSKDELEDFYLTHKVIKVREVIE